MPFTFAPTRILAIAGTRPECLKLASPVRALRARRQLSVTLLGSGQHAGMVAQTSEQIGLPCDIALAPLLSTSLTRNVQILRDRIAAIALTQRSEMLIVQGDTATAYAGALAGRALDLPVAHVEAGLRSPSLHDPFPEEWFRRQISRIASLHFAPTAIAARNLLIEGISPDRVHETGNTIIDLLRVAVDASAAQTLDFVPPCEQLAVLTLHRRNNHGAVSAELCDAVLALLQRQPRLGLVCPLHPNPAASAPIRLKLGAHPRVTLTEPLDYYRFIALLGRSHLAISDSGGLQEETPYLGTPLLIARAGTERPEALLSGLHSLLPNPADLVDAAEAILARPRPAACGFDANAPYGDGHASERIADVVEALFRLPHRQSAAPAFLPAHA